MSRNRLKEYFDGLGYDDMTETDIAAAGSNGPKSLSPRKRMAERLRERMADQGKTPEDCGEAMFDSLDTGSIESHTKTVKGWMKNGIPSPSKIRLKAEFHAMATFLECNVKDFWSDKWTKTSEPEFDDDEEFIDMAKEALKGPRADFLKEAIYFTHAAFKNSLPRRT